MKPCLPALLVPLGLALLLAPLAGSAQTRPALDLKAARDLAEKFDHFTHPQGAATWEKGDLLPTSKEDDAKAWEVEGGTITTDNEGLKMVANGAGCYVTLAKRTFKGPIGIRYEAMTPQGVAPCDLSVRFGPADSPSMVTLAFGGYNNTQNFFYLGKVRKVLAGEPMIVPGQWYAVECLLTADTVIGKVDGKVIGEEKLDVPVTAESEHDVALYVWASTGIFRNVQLLRYAPPVADTRKWGEVMGQTTQDDLRTLARTVAPLLGDDDFTTRKLADEILFALRPLSAEPLRQQLKSPDAEARGRAERLLARMGLGAAAAPVPATQPTE